jgi:hypothetical protein
MLRFAQHDNMIPVSLAGRKGTQAMLRSSVLRTAFLVGLALLAIHAAAFVGGGIASAQPAPPARPDAPQPPAPSAPPAASDSQPATSQPARPSTIDLNIKNAQLILTDLKKTFQAGQVEVEVSTGAGRDNRMGLLALLVTQKIPYMINKRIADADEREAAQAEARKAGEYIDNTLVPAFNKARQSKRPEDARGLVALMDELDGHLTGMQKAISTALSVAPAAPPAPGPQQRGLPEAGSSASNAPPPARVPPRAATSEPLDDWTRYVQQFVTTNGLNDMQQKLAWSILKELKARAQEYQISHRAEYEELSRMQDKAGQSQRLLVLNKPVRDMFDELKGRLSGLLTEAQRNTVSPAGPGSK